MPISYTTKIIQVWREIKMEPENKNKSLGIIIARTSAISGNVKQAVDLGVGAWAKGQAVGVFLISDGVWNGLKNAGEVSNILEQLVKDGASLYISDEHARAAGMPKERVIEGAEFIDDTYKTLVDKVMERWDKMIIC